MISSEVGVLKRRAADLAVLVYRRMDTADCGRHLLEHISPDLARARRELDATLDRLREIDPEFPR